ncbi:sarcosine oxidase subunit delta [uncultured Tateyamaria sp.]|uniref:sarcosine oxidase subunit delta n=1 Tax=uncultured Tateyamaria sp. TaxID=455651 RepID=UPI00262592F9|nr:sarcosine oxidase subunit delta [uncultured Tateyamaria sp.]
MRISCPICGERDHREFYYQGAAVMLSRPAPDAGEAAWDDYLYLRENQPGDLEELWSHDAGCGAWLKVLRNTVTHTVHSTELVTEARR